MNRRQFSRAILSGTAVLVAGPVVLAQSAAPPPPAPPKAPAPAPPKAPPAAAGSLTAEEIAERVQAFYDKTKTFRAGFRQRYVMPIHKKTIDSNGSVVFEKPGKMSWRYSNNGNRVVSDGKIIKIYEKENKQMYEQPLDKTPYPAALSFLTGTASLRQSFKITKLDPKQMGVEGGYVLLGEPKEATPAYQKMFLYVDAGTFHVRRVMLLDAQRNRNRFDFVNPEVNVKTPAGEFAFNPPPGTQIIRP